MSAADFATREAREALADRVRAARGARALSQVDAAAAGGVSHLTWIRVEEGAPVRLGSYFGVERALGWPAGSIADFLVTGQEPRPGWLSQEQALALVMDSQLPERRKVALVAAIRRVWALHQAQTPNANTPG